MGKISGAKALLEALKKEGVSIIFGIPGGAILPIYDELYDFDIRHVLCQHEQSAAHMADGFARACGKPGVCFATSGPGATNLVTGIANAYMDSSPLIAVTGQVPKSMIGKDAFQEVDIIGITTPITKYNFQPRSASEIPEIVKKAFFIASTGRKGPVLIDIPKDVQTEEFEAEFPEKVTIRGYNPYKKPCEKQINIAVKWLASAERPMILAGGGAIYSEASSYILKISEFLLAPVATSLMGKGVFPEDHPLSLGLLGMHGTLAANKLVSEADVLLSVGTRFSDRTTGKVDEFCKEAKVIHIDIDEAEISKNKKVDLAIIADASEALKAIYEKLINYLSKKEETPWFKRVKEFKEIWEGWIFEEESNKELKPIPILKILRKILPIDSILVTEVGQNQMWSALYFKVFKPKTFITSGGLGTMGFGLPASIGAKAAKPDVPVVDVAGDGSFMMTENALSVSVAENLPIIAVIINNKVLGMVAQWQRLFYGKRYSAVKLDRVDFVKLAEAYGAHGVRVQDLNEFSNALKECLKLDVASVIDVPISPEENVLPMVPPGSSLEKIMGVEKWDWVMKKG
ncbi:MAG: biosynthetic-type acetolactate synthase large subunit [Candidatus Bathyarchaeia archaeon]|nr:biosynthetic-type acetolactate synthase large subunit [Candidatus Bathyarchaeota archaeon]